MASVPDDTRDVEVTASLDGATLGSVLVTATRLPGSRLGVQLRVMPTNDRPGPPLAAGVGIVTLDAPAANAPFALVASRGAEAGLAATRLGR